MTTTKTSGLGSVVTIDDASSVAQIISTDITNYQFATPKGVQDITGVDKSAHERLLLLADYSATFNGVFDNGASLAHAVFKTISSTAVNRNVKIQPTSTGTPYLSCLCVLTDYSLTRAAAGELTYSVPAALADGTVPTWT